MGLDFSEVYYADDTILLGNDVREIQKTLRTIESVSREYGLRLNEDKCEHIQINGSGDVRFANEKKVPVVEHATYLGARIDAKCDIGKEINERIATCRIIWKRMELFWKKTNCSKKTKINVYMSIIRSKLVY